MSALLGIHVAVAAGAADCVPNSDICITCTTSEKPVLMTAHLRPGLFIAAVGADNPHKQELDPTILAAGTLVCDSTRQCADFGELRHAIAAGVMTAERVHAELSQIIAGQRPGRTTRQEITIYDSTGTATQDVAAAIVAYEQARNRGLGTAIQLMR